MAKTKTKTSKKTKMENKEKPKAAGATAECNDRDCPFHGSLKARGRIFKGRVIRKFSRRVTIEFERMVYFRKFERYAQMKTKIHARLPECMKKNIEVGDMIRIQECRPLSKIIHFVVIEKIDEKKNKEETK